LNLKELGIYKDIAIRKIIFDSNTNELNQDIIKIISNNQEITTEELLKENIFPFEYVPDIKNDQKTFICIDTNVPSFKTDTCKDIQLLLYVFTHKDLMRYTEAGEAGTRVDILCHKIDEKFNGSNDFGIGRLKQKSVLSYKSLNENYYGKVIIYSVPEYNRNRKIQNG